MSGIYLEEEGHPENSVSLSDIGRENTNTYQSLFPSSSRSELLPASTSAVTGATEAYLHARESCRTQHLSDRSHRHSSRHSHRHNHGKRFSRSTTVIQSEELKLLYLKVKIGFLIICLINVLVVVFCVLTNPKFNVFPDDDAADFLDTGDGQPKSFKLCTKCQPLEAKVDTADGLIRTIRSQKYPDFCCFKRVDQLLQLVDWYSKAYAKQEADHINLKFKPNSEGKASQPTAAQLYFSDYDSSKSVELRQLTWETEGINIQLSGFKLKEKSVLVIQDTGYYYMYSHLVFKKSGTNSTYRHMIHINTGGGISLEDRGTVTGTTSSALQGIYKLKKGNNLTVLASYDKLLKEGRRNYFGMYKL